MVIAIAVALTLLPLWTAITLSLNHATMKFVLGLHYLENLLSRYDLENSLVGVAFYLCHINLQLVDFLNSLGVALGVALDVLLQFIDLNAHLALTFAHFVVEGEENFRLVSRQGCSLSQRLLHHLLEFLWVESWLSLLPIGLCRCTQANSNYEHCHEKLFHSHNHLSVNQ